MEILSLGEKIKRSRKEQNMTLKDLAGDRITPGQISLVESGKSNPSMDLLEYLAGILNVSIEYLMETEESQAEKICGYFENIADSHIFTRTFDLAQQYIKSSLYYANKYDLEYKKARALYLEGKIALLLEDYAQAQQLLLSSNVIFIKYNYHGDIVKTYIKLGRIALEMKAYHSACSYFKQAENVFVDNSLSDELTLGQIFYYIANTYYKLEDIEQSVNYSYLAKQKFQQVGNKKEYAKSLLLFAQGANKSGDIDAAIKHSKKALELFKEIDELMYISEIENNLGKLFYEFDNVEESFIHFNMAKKIREEFQDEQYIDTLVNICENHIKLKDIKNAKNILESIKKSAEKINEKYLIKYYVLKYRVDIIEGDSVEAEYTLEKALSFAKEKDLKEEYADLAIMIGRFYISTGNNEAAAKYLSSGVELFENLGLI
ncbi:helix-turn-helix domain-containing protein [Clostridium grantii]|uniref:Tetratricopeptide repeat-containing protein n=1 Tax=Clostridium grantii DSM 8605 TaxID=1121316 RepID=A0A1M5UWH7_9CLOT|nr:helix-turn-helix transcriptional regulator [Clostridium grantii]SHH67270.1 Tetratricopeptide repeat-containing protein [Clostridium grantii DSM 8605]